MGMNFHQIGKVFSVDEKTAKKAVLKENCGGDTKPFR
jgi:hypothetical protein